MNFLKTHLGKPGAGQGLKARNPILLNEPPFHPQKVHQLADTASDNAAKARVEHPELSELSILGGFLGSLQVTLQDPASMVSAKRPPFGRPVRGAMLAEKKVKKTAVVVPQATRTELLLA